MGGRKIAVVENFYHRAPSIFWFMPRITTLISQKASIHHVRIPHSSKERPKAWKAPNVISGQLNFLISLLGLHDTQ